MELRPTTLSVWTGPRPGPKLDEIDRFYGLYGRSVGVFNVAGVLRKVMPEDWSHFERLRFDVLITWIRQNMAVARVSEENILVNSLKRPSGAFRSWNNKYLPFNILRALCVSVMLSVC
jgi:hypothetical protein